MIVPFINPPLLSGDAGETKPPKPNKLKMSARTAWRLWQIEQCLNMESHTNLNLPSLE